MKDNEKIFLMSGSLHAMKKYIKENNLNPKDCVPLAGERDIMKLRGHTGATIVKVSGWDRLPGPVIRQIYAAAQATKSTIK